MRLENNLMYQPMYEQKALPAPRERQEVYTVGNLESMSASALYSGEKTRIKKDGTVEKIDIDKDKDAIKTYVDLVNNRIYGGMQNSKEKHDGWSELGAIDLGEAYDKGSQS